MRRFYCTIMLLCLPVLSQATRAEDGASEKALSASVNALLEIVLDRHIDPPTKQEMVLSGVRALYRVAVEPQPRGLSRRISELSTAEQIDEFIQDVVGNVRTTRDSSSIVIQGMLDCVRGGATLTDAATNRVNSQVAANRYVGTGIALGYRKDAKRPLISKVFHDGPAWKAGAKSQDLILEIDGRSTSSMPMNEVLEALRGEAGSEVRMVVQQSEDDESRELLVTRGRVFLPSVEGVRQTPEGRWKYTLEDAPQIALIRLKRIGPSTLHELRRLENTFRDGGVRGIILDFRSGGALLHDVVMVADALIDDSVIGHVQSLDGRQTYKAQPGAMFKDLPMVVLTSRFTSAGHVFLTAALQDSGRAVVVGQRTSGNTYVKSLIDVPGRDEQITLATAVMHRADRTPLLVLQNQRPADLVFAIESEAAARKQRQRYILPDFVVDDSRLPSDNGQRKDKVVKTAIDVIVKALAKSDSQPAETVD